MLGDQPDVSGPHIQLRGCDGTEEHPKKKKKKYKKSTQEQQKDYRSLSRLSSSHLSSPVKQY
jgi:hypothetical protein